MIALSLCGGCRWGSAGQNTVGLQLYQQGRYAEALQQFESARQTDPTNPNTYHYLGNAYARLGQQQNDQQMLAQAETLYNQCLDLHPNHTPCYHDLAELLVNTGRSDKAFTLVRNWVTTNPTLVDARVELATLQARFDQKKEAEQTLDEALAMDPNSATAWAARGRLREEGGDLPQAIQNYQQSLALNALQPDLYQRVAALNVRLAQNTISTANAPVIAGGTAPTPSTEATTKRY